MHQGTRRHGLVRFACVAAIATCALIWSQREPVSAAIGIGYWTFEDVAAVGLMPGCGPGVSIIGFQFDPLGRPALGWETNSGCSFENHTWWTRKEEGAWNTRVFEPGIPFLAGGDADSQHTFALNHDGNPYMMFRSADPSTGDNNIYSFLADLGVSPTGLSYSRKEFLIGSQNCYYGGYFLEFGPQDSTPQWLSTLNLCSPWYGQMWLNGVKFANGIIWNGADFAIGPDGARHVVYAATTVYYSNGSGPGTPIPDMSRIDPGTGQPLPLQINRFSGDVQVVVDPSNVIHVFARGYDSQADWDIAKLVRVSSSDGGATWTAPEIVEGSRTASNVAATVDQNGALALAFWRFGQLWYATKASGQWEFSLVTGLPNWQDFDADRRVVLAFDASNVPAIAFFDWNYNLAGAKGKVRVAHPAPAGANDPADLAASFGSGPDPARVGEQVTITAGASNASSRNADGTTLTVTLAAGLSYVSATPEPTSINGQQLVFSLGTLTSGGTATVGVKVTSAQAGTFTSQVVAGSALIDPNSANNTVSGITRYIPGTCFTPPSGLTRWWRAEGTGADSIGGITAAPTGTVTYGPGIYGQAFQFDGTTGRFDTFSWDDGPEYPGTGSFSIDAWIKTTTGGMIASKYECSEAWACAPSYYFFFVSGGRLGISLRDSQSHSFGSTGLTSVADGAWHHVAFVLDRSAGLGGEVRLFVDGVLDATADASALARIGDDNGIRNSLVIGARNNANAADSGFFGGAIDELAVHQRALTAAEVISIAQAPSTAVCGAAVNQAPTITSPGDQGSDEGTSVDLAIIASDPDGNTLAFSASGLPPGLSVNPTTGVISGSLDYSSAGAYDPTITVSDGTLQASVTFHWTINNVNRAPVASGAAASTNEDTPVAITLAATDADANPLTFSIVAPPQHGAVSLTGTTATYTPSSNYNGTDAFTFTASDGPLNSNVATVTITVTPVNDAPEVSTPGNQTSDEGTAANLTIGASDPDGDMLTFGASGLPPGLAINSTTGVISGSLDYSSAGAYDPTITVSDGTLQASVTFHWTVNNVNRAPVASGAAASTNEDTPVAITLAATDADANPLTFSIVAPPQHGTVTLTGSTAAYTPSPNYNGTDAFTFKASDGALDSNVATVTITVTPVNDAPTLAPLSNVTVESGALVSFALSGSDPDGDTLAYSAAGLPSGATLLGPAFTWTPGVADVGPHVIVFTARDPGNLSASQGMTITVTSAPVTNRPVQCAGARPSIAELWPADHRAVPIDILGLVDPDGDSIHITVTGILQDEPTNTVGDGNTPIDGGLLSPSRAWIRAERTGTPQVPGNGRVYEIRFSADDGRGGTCTGAVTVGVPHDRGKGPAVDDGVRYDSTVAGGPQIRR